MRDSSSECIYFKICKYTDDERCPNYCSVTPEVQRMMLRTLAEMITCECCVFDCENEGDPDPDCITKLIDYAQDNPTNEGEIK